MNDINKTDIPVANKYEGYYWMSDAKAPKVLNDEHLSESDLTRVNPFIVEAELWDAEHKTSYAIHQAGNEVICKEYEVADGDINDMQDGLDKGKYVVNRVTFIPHRMDGKKLEFLEYWEEKDNPDIPETMNVLELSRRVFVGFNHKEE